MANPEGGSVNRRTIDDSNAVVNSGSVMNKNEPEAASDTEQYGGVDATSQRSGSKKKACFQITHITSKRSAAEHDPNMDDADSNDELDESRVDEYSSSELVDSFNVSRNSISDHEQAINEGVVVGNANGNVPVIPTSSVSGTVSASASTSAEEQTNSNVPVSANQANGNGPHRFKVVKVATEPIRKGRWTCRDFPSETKPINQTTPDSIRNQDSSKEALVHSGNSSAASSVHYIHGQDNNSDNPLAPGDDSGKQTDLSRKISSTSSKDVGNPSDTPEGEDQKDERLGLEQLKDELQEHTSDSSEGGGDDGTSPAGGAIDNKIEQAMDLVKSHLLFAVREEVEVLKEQIKILVDKNEKLQEENSTLKQRLQQQKGLGALPGQPQGQAPPSQGQAPPQPQGQPGQQAQGQPGQQGMPVASQAQPTHPSMTMPSQEQPAYTNMPNQIGQASLGQNPMGQAISDHAAYPTHPRPTQTHSAPNPGGLPEGTPQYTPQTSLESQQGQYQGLHSQRHLATGQPSQQTHLAQQSLQDVAQYSQVTAKIGGTAGAAPQPTQQTQPQPMQGQYPAGGRPNATH